MLISNFEEKQQSWDRDIPLNGQGYAQAIALNPDGKLLAIGTRTDIKIWNLDDSQASEGLVMTLADDDWINSLAFSREGTELAIGTKQSVYVCSIIGNVAAGEPIRIPEPIKNGESVAFDIHDRLMLLQWSKKRVRLLSRENGYKTPAGTDIEVSGPLFLSPSGRYLFSKQDLWDLLPNPPVSRTTQSWRERFVVTTHGPQALGPQGRWLVMARPGFEFNVVHLRRLTFPLPEKLDQQLWGYHWKVGKGQLDLLLKLAEMRVSRNLTKAEWQLYLPKKPYRKTFPDLSVEE